MLTLQSLAEADVPLAFILELNDHFEGYPMVKELILEGLKRPEYSLGLFFQWVLWQFFRLSLPLIFVTFLLCRLIYLHREQLPASCVAALSLNCCTCSKEEIRGSSDRAWILLWRWLCAAKSMSVSLWPLSQHWYRMTPVFHIVESRFLFRFKPLLSHQ